MKVKCLSIKNPISYLVCSGIKDVENRTWTTEYRGPLYIHSSGQKDFFELWPHLFPEEYIEKYGDMYSEGYQDDEKSALIRAFDKKVFDHYGVDQSRIISHESEMEEKIYGSKDPFLKARAIIGRVELVDIITNSASPWSEKGCYHWIFENVELFDKPIYNVLGRLRLFEINI